MYTIDTLKFNTILLLFLCFHLATNARQRYTVTVTDDTPDIFQGDGLCGDINGNCSLRAAIMQANASPGIDTIHFSILGVGPFTISLEDFLDPISESLVIDGSTQPNYTRYAPLIVLSGTQLGPGGEGLTVVANNCTIKGLVIGGFLEDVNGDFGTGVLLINAQNCTIIDNFIGIAPDGETPFGNFVGLSLDVFSANNTIGGINTGNVISGNRAAGIELKLGCIANRIQGNFIGTNKDGDAAVGNEDGVIFDNGSNINLIGGSSPQERNIISGNIDSGIEITNSTSNIFYGNYIGTDFWGTRAIPNDKGIFLLAAAADLNQIGGGRNGKGNLIAGNTNMGIDLQGSGNLILGNFIGTQIDGNSPLPNGLVGIWIRNGQNNQIGNANSGGGNIIAHHTGDGVRVDNGGLSSALQNQISRNSIFGNADLGIDLGYNKQATNGPTYIDVDDSDIGPNNLQNFATINAPSYDNLTQTLTLTYDITSSPANASYPMTVEFFVADEQGQGKTYIGSDIYSLNDFLSGPEKNITFTALTALEGTENIINTVTDADNNTSEFYADAPLPAHTINFDGEDRSEGIFLSWDKINSSFYESYQIEKLDSSASFTPISHVSKNEGFEKTFFWDRAPDYGRNIYRLKVVDKFGQTSYSSLVEVWWNEQSQFEFVLTSNPARSHTELFVIGKRPKVLQLQLQSFSGQMIRQWTTNVHNNPSIDLQGLSSGAYILRIHALKEGVRKNIKMIVID